MSARVTKEEYNIITKYARDNKISLQDLFIDGLYVLGVFKDYEGIQDDKPAPVPAITPKKKKANSGRKQKAINQIKDGRTIKTFKNSEELGEAGYNKGNVSRVCNGKAKSAHGYQWEFVKDEK